MNSIDFVDKLKRYVETAAIEDTISNVKRPPGRRVPPQEKACSDWYNALSDIEAAHVNNLVALAAHHTLFGILAVLDGARKIDDGGGSFELAYLGEKRTVLNGPEAVPLHDVLNASD